MFQIKEVSVEEIIREVEIFQEKAPREYKQDVYSCRRRSVSGYGLL